MSVVCWYVSYIFLFIIHSILNKYPLKYFLNVQLGTIYNNLIHRM